MKAKHTPGPWEVAPHPDDAEMVEIVRDFVEVAGGRKQAQWIGECDAGIDSDMSEDEWREAIDRNHGNARLMAAAPELLDALRAFCGDYESTPLQIPEIHAAYRHALTVIAKATGEARDGGTTTGEDNNEDTTTGI